MMKNEGTIDRWIRGIIAIIFFYAGYYSTVGLWSILAYVLGIVLLLTAITGYCPLYKALGISTRKKM